MKKFPIKSARRLGASLLVALAFATGQSAYAQTNSYQQHNLVANVAGTADFTDPNLINPWGVAFNPFGLAWVADNGTGVSTLYDGLGTPNSLVVQIPSPSGSSGGHPTGIVFNGSSNFVVSAGSFSAASRFIFATEEGVIAGWAPDVDPTHAIRINNSAANGAVYKGLALSANGTDSLLYAADFHNNKIDVFDGAFQPVALTTGAFTDPNLPGGFAPFGIQTINGSIYVSYAKQDESKQDDVKGAGLGFVNVFSPNGVFIKRLVTQGSLNAPWGMALAPADFGEFGSRLLVGNFGDGTINAYDIATGNLVGQLIDTNGSLIKIDGLWALVFGNGFANQPVNALFFSAGPNDEQDGLYGRIDTLDSLTGQQDGITGGIFGEATLPMIPNPVISGVTFGQATLPTIPNPAISGVTFGQATLPTIPNPAAGLDVTFGQATLPMIPNPAISGGTFGQTTQTILPTTSNPAVGSAGTTVVLRR